MSTPASRRPALAWLALGLVVLVLDQWSKQAVLGAFLPGERLNLVPAHFDLTLVFNTGAAFSMLADAGGWQRWFFTVLGLGASGWMAWMVYREPHRRILSCALTLLAAGALGNVIDRLRWGKVVDFLLAYWGNAYFPAFNLADSAITLGAGLLILDELLRHRRRPATGGL